MKNQYVGDINDYRKYGLIRLLSDGGALRLGVAWMLTPSDGRTDGAKTGYLTQPRRFAQHDRPLFAALHDMVHHQRRRTVTVIEDSGILPNARYFSDILADELPARQAHMNAVHRAAMDFDLLFFDPDNGLDVKSVPMGRRDSSKYFYRSELERFAATPASLLIYQHFPRVDRTTYMDQIAADLTARTGRTVWSFHTAHVVFFLLPAPGTTDAFARRAAAVETAWQGQVVVRQHG
jgi:hypothetical protein